MRRFLRAALAVAGLAVTACSAPEAESSAITAESRTDPLLIAVAASAVPAMEQVAQAFTAQTGVPVTLSGGASGLLKQQAEGGAPFDLFYSADMRRVEELAGAGLLAEDSVVPYAQGVLLFWTGLDEFQDVPVEDWSGFYEPPLDIWRFSIANPDTAPYGLAARQTLERAGVYERLMQDGRIIVAGNIRQAYDFAATGNVDAAFVSKSLLVSEGRTEGVLRAATIADHPPIVHGCGVLLRSERPDLARRFWRFTLSEEGARILQEHGFEKPAEPLVTRD
ncbi:MAG: molybdate ABC transporter substrate-binding protein [Sumerlaeia bacterium]